MVLVHIDSLFSVHCPPYFIVVPKSSTRAKQPSLVQVVLGRSDGGQEGGGGDGGGECGGSTSAWLWRERDFQGQKALLFFPPTPPCCSLLVVLLITISTLNVLCLTMTKATLRTVFIANKHTCMLYFFKK